MDTNQRQMTDQERIEARHRLQEAIEHARVLRDAMDPQHGVPWVRVVHFAVDIERIVGPLLSLRSSAAGTQAQDGATATQAAKFLRDFRGKEHSQLSREDLRAIEHVRTLLSRYIP